MIYFRQIFGAIELMLHKKPFLKNRNENDVTVTFFKKTSNGNNVTIFREGK
jgi:hypothetical protein